MNIINSSLKFSDVTRVSETFSITIDLILISDIDTISKGGPLKIEINDHCMIYCTLKA